MWNAYKMFLSRIAACMEGVKRVFKKILIWGTIYGENGIHFSSLLVSLVFRNHCLVNKIELNFAKFNFFIELKLGNI